MGTFYVCPPDIRTRQNDGLTIVCFKYNWEGGCVRAACSVEYWSPFPTVMAPVGGEQEPKVIPITNATDEMSIKVIVAVIHEGQATISESRVGFGT